MNKLVQIALNRPYTFVVLALLLLIVGPLALAFFLATMRFHARDLQREGPGPLEAGERPALEA